jgi:hypothetical protein
MHDVIRERRGPTSQRIVGKFIWRKLGPSFGTPPSHLVSIPYVAFSNEIDLRLARAGDRSRPEFAAP